MGSVVQRQRLSKLKLDTEENEEPAFDGSFHKDLSSYLASFEGAGGPVAGNRVVGNPTAVFSPTTESATNNELMAAMMNIDDISVNLLEQKLYQGSLSSTTYPTTLQAPLNKSKSSTPNNSTYKILGSLQKLNPTGQSKNANFTPGLRKKADHDEAIPQFIYRTIAETIEAAESAGPPAKLNGSGALLATESQPNVEATDQSAEEDETSYYDKTSEISDVEVLKNTEALMNKYGALYQS